MSFSRREKRDKKKKHQGILLAALLILVFLLYKGCAEPGFSKKERAVTDSCENFLRAYQMGDSEEITKWMADAAYGSDVNLQGYPEIVGKTMKYRIKEITNENEEKYEIRVEIKALDLAALAGQEEFGRQITEDNLLDVLQRMSDDGDVPVKEYPVLIRMVKENGTWKVKMDNLLSDALLGGYVTFYQQILEEAGEI